MLTVHEFSHAMVGAWRLARLDPQGMEHFNRTIEGFWRSFWVGVLTYPGFLILLALRLPDAEWTRAGAFRILSVETIGYIIGWVAFPLAMVPMTRFLDREERYLDFIIAYNWAQLLHMALFLFIEGVAGSGLVSVDFGHLLSFVATIAVLLYEWFIARIALDVAGPPATAVVLLDLVLAVLISRVSDALH